MDYIKLLENARSCIGAYCKACPTCNGIACKNLMPGPGSKGVGDTAIRNYQKWQEIRINMDTIHHNRPVNTNVEIFSKNLKMPVFAGPIGAVNLHYGDKYTDQQYNDILVRACSNNGILAFTGDGINPQVMIEATSAIIKHNGNGIPTVKPWNIDTIKEKLELVKKSNAFAVSMDIDAAGLPFLKNQTPPAGSKSVEELKEIIQMIDVPFIIKGIMTVNGAIKAKQAGAKGIVVSNHGGRVLDQCPSTVEVLEDIVNAVGNDMKIFVDGGIRTGTDIFKALALGADAVIIARPFVTAVYGGEDEGVLTYINKLESELKDTMSMCGAYEIKDINKDMLYLK